MRFKNDWLDRYEYLLCSSGPGFHESSEIFFFWWGGGEGHESTWSFSRHTHAYLSHSDHFPSLLTKMSWKLGTVISQSIVPVLLMQSSWKRPSATHAACFCTLHSSYRLYQHYIVNVSDFIQALFDCLKRDMSVSHSKDQLEFIVCRVSGHIIF